MKCPACNHENRDGAKFCEECAAPLKRLCASCGAELRPTAKFCDECGATTATGGARSESRASGAHPARAAEAAGARKVVTVVFADLIGSTALHERVDAESARRLMERYYDALRTAVEEHGGTVVKLLGDGVMAAFGVPQVAEDDAVRAVRAGVTMQDAFRTLVGEQAASLGDVGLRVAVNTGEVVVSGANDDVVGDPVNIAARLQQEARDGDVVIGEATQRLVSTLVTLEPLGNFALKGRAEAVKAYRIVSLEQPAGAATTAFVGRDDELARITRVYDAAVATPAARLAVLLGSPGLGKSRLIEELARRRSETATVISAHCDATGGATFAPLAHALRSALNIDDSASVEALRAAVDADTPGSEPDRARIVDGITTLLAGSPASPEETFFVVRRLLAALAKERPVVLVIDDLHWAEPLLLDLVEHLIQWGSGVPLLVLVGARPELRDARSSLATPGGLVADVITLSGLDAGAAMRLAANVIGAADLPAAVAAKVLATSEGNPLFVGELIRMLVQEGALERQGDRWIIGAGLAELEMPPTIHALLAARIERLRAEERIVLERAAVVGRNFSRSAVAELLPRDVTDLDARLESLRRSELIERDTGWFLGEPVLRFHHVLIRDAAYRRVLKGTRAELHARFADWIEARQGESVEHDEILGWHLEQAHLYLGELGPIDAKGRVLGERAARYLAVAGRRALARDDLPLAASLLGRALARLDADDPSRADLALDWCEALLATGDVGPAAGAIDELGRFITDSERLRAWHTCFAGQLTVFTEPQALHATADAVAAAAETLTSLGDAAGEAKAHFVHAQALARLGKIGASEAALDRALAAARRAGDRRRANAVLAGAPLAALWGPSPVTRASGRCLDVVRVLRITQGAPAVEAVALSCQGVLEALRGRTDAARRMIASSRKMVEELGITHRLLEADVFAGQIDLLEGDAVAAERSLRSAYEGLRDLGLGIDAAQSAALLARALLAQGRAAEAEALSHESEALAGDDLKAAIAWRGVRAEALARRGEHAVAVELAEAAVTIAAATDALLDHADARLALAAALRAAGRGGEANAEERRATELWEAKGATLLAERARRGVARVEAPTQAREARIEPRTPARRGVPPNNATARTGRFDAAFAARDRVALEETYADAVTVVDHPTESTYGREGAIDSFVRMFRMEDPRVRHEAVATLGESLGLFRFRLSARGTGGGRFDVAEFDREEITVYEADEYSRLRRVEVFATDHLDGAIAHLYERYAELMPEGDARARASATWQAVAAILRRTNDAERWRTVCVPDAQMVDHRRLGTWNARGSDAIVTQMGSLQAVADDVVLRTLEVLALEPEALLLRRMHSGTERVGGGTYERPLLLLLAFGPDGRVARAEFFDDDAEAEALARFDEIVGSSVVESVRSVRRRVRPNATNVWVARVEAAIRGRESGALDALLTDHHETVDHPTGIKYGREGTIASFESLLWLQDFDFRYDVLATLGESLGLVRRVLASRGRTTDKFDVAEYEVERIGVYELDEAGRLARAEVFSAEHLADAIIRLYELRAAQLPEGPSRQRAAGIARSISKMYRNFVDPKHLADPFAADVEMVDHRRVGLGTLHGAESVLDAVRAFLELVQNAAWRADDVLALTDNAGIQRSTNSGTDRVSGGPFERVILSLLLHDEEGRVCRWETFESDAEAEALARFDELTGATATAPVGQQAAPRFANAATRLNEGFVRTWAARDWDAFMALHAPKCELDDRRRLMRVEESTISNFPTLQMLFEVPGGRWTSTPIATRGERLALSRMLFEGQFVEGGGDLAIDYLCVDEVDAEGLSAVVILFDLDELDAAYAELDARYAAGEAKVHPHVSEFLQEFRDGIAERDWESFAAICAPGIVAEDHRLVSWGTLRGSVAWVGALKSLVDLAPDIRLRVDHVRMSPFGLLYEGAWVGTRDGGELEIPLVAAIELDERGRQLRLDVYDVDHFDDARARFDAIDVRKLPAESRFDNSASRAWRVVIEVWRNRDLRRFSALHPPELRYRDHRRLFELDLDRDGFLEFTRPLLEMRALGNSLGLVATRGERLALMRSTLEMEDDTVGPSTIESLILSEVDERGVIVAYDRYDCDDLDAAYAELDARYAAGEGAQHRRVVAALNAGDRAIAARDWAAVVASHAASGFYLRDHRLLGWGSTVRDIATFVRVLQSLFELAPDARYRTDHLRVSGRGHLSLVTQVGTREGGAFESPMLRVTEVDELGIIQGHELYNVEDVDRALARFSELSSSRVSRDAYFENSATRVARAIFETYVALDWRRFEPLFADGFRLVDRRRIAQIELDRGAYFAYTHELDHLGARSGESEVLATRGESLCLLRYRFEFAGGSDVGASVIEFLTTMEADAEGACVRAVRFDLDDRDAAYDELDARYEAGEARAHPLALTTMTALRRAWAERNWSGLIAACGPDFHLRDHRLLGWGTTVGNPAEWVRTQQALVDLAPDVRIRTDHVRLAARGWLRHAVSVGTREGGAFELPLVMVTELDEHGKLAGHDLYDPEQIEQAFARFEEIRAAAAAEPESRFSNAASCALDRTVRCFNARDWNGMVATYTPTHRMDDRRKLMRIEVAGEGFFANEKLLFDVPGSAWHAELIATRGDRLALCRVRFTAGGEDAGPMAVDVLDLVEVDADGRRTTLVVFDPDDIDAAHAELDARFTAGEVREYPLAAAYRLEFGSALSRRDWDAAAGVYAPDLVAHDSRLVGWGTMHGPTEIVKPLKAMLDLAPDARLRADHVRVSSRGWLFDSVWVGTRDGGAFESEFLSVVDLDAHGKARRVDFYDTHRADEAFARFEALRLCDATDQSAGVAKPNAAQAAMVRWQAGFEAGVATRDWSLMRDACAPTMIFEDRQRLVLVSGDRELMIASILERVAVGARPEARWIGAAGDRVGVWRALWSGGPAEGRFEVEHLVLFEVDADGRITAVIVFDVDNPRAARREAWERWAAIDPVAAPWVVLLTEIADAWNAHDRAGVRRAFADDVVVEDHRRTGLGRVDGADAYIEANAVLWDLAPDQRIEFGWSWPALDRHAALVTLRREGTLADGGAFENDYLFLSVADRGRITRLELFEPEDLDAALARFDELWPDPLDIAPNAATRAGLRVRDAMERADWEAIPTLCHESFVYEDRGKRSLVSGDVETWIASMRFMVAIPDYRNESRTIATIGERISVGCEVWTGGADTAAFEIEHFRVSEVAADGKYLATILFDPEDRAAAFLEALKRFVTGEAATTGAEAVSLAGYRFSSAHVRRDWGALRETLTPDFVYHDHRALGVLGVLDGDQWVASMRAQVDISSDSALETQRLLTWNRHGVVGVYRTFGTVPGGGPFESVFVGVVHAVNERFQRFEAFDLDDVDRALARFEALRPNPLRIPPNAVTRALDRLSKLAAVRDWAALRALMSEDFVFEDRGKRSLVKGGIEEIVGGLTYYVSEVGAAGRQEMLATAGERLALTRISWRGVQDDAQFELARLAVNEVNDEGKICATLFFDDEDRGAASTEMTERYIRSTAGLPSATLEVLRAWNDHDLARLRALLPADYYLYDRRRTGVGRLDGPDAYLASLEALFQLSRDVRIETLYLAARAPHGVVNVTRWSGTNVEGGEFEAVYVLVGLQRGARILGVEIFEIEDLDAALARLEELRPDPLRIPPNAATRAADRLRGIYLARDWDALRALVAPDFVYDDRSKRALVVGDVETWTGAMQFTRQPGFRVESSLLAALGDRVALHRVVWSGEPGGDAFEFERIRLFETGPDGRVRIAIFFDPEDRVAAFSEALERFLAGEAAAMNGRTALLESQRAHARRDWSALRETMAPDFVFQDHRTLGMLGVLDRDGWIASIQALVDMSPDHAVEWSRMLAWNRHGFVALTRTFGTVPDGGPFENVYISVRLMAEDFTQRFEFFDLDHADRALARFEELCATTDADPGVASQHPKT